MKFLLLTEEPASVLAFSYGSFHNQSRINRNTCSTRKTAKDQNINISAEAWGVIIQIPVTIHE
jgi:hypothetical protein